MGRVLVYEQDAPFGTLPCYYWRMTSSDDYDPDYKPIPDDTTIGAEDE